MDVMDKLLRFLGGCLVTGGGIAGIIGLIKFISGGKSHDPQAQESAGWMLLLAGALVGVGGAMATGLVKFPSFPA